MSHVQPAMDRLIAALRPIYPALPPRGVAGDEQPGDFELAGYLGFRPDATFTFDTGYVPVDKTIAHELMHAAHELANGRLSPDSEGRLTGAAYVYTYDDPVLVGFHEAMRYPVDLRTMIDTAVDHPDPGGHVWGAFIGEQLAEAFGYLIARYRTGSTGGIWATWGGDLNARLNDGSLDAFFRSLRPFASPWFPGGTELTEQETRALILKVLDEQGYPTTVEAVKDALARHIHDEPTVAFPLASGEHVPVPTGATGPAHVPAR